MAGKIPTVKYILNFTPVNIDSVISAEDLGAGVAFINQGTSTVRINGLILTPQKSWDYFGNLGEIDITEYNIIFDTSTGTDNQLIVVRKVYQTT